jgi:acyl-CoA reductase-like NAD-dependent aldehyde dehydrogenase
VVFKPSEETPLCGQAYADILNAALPPDVLIIMHGADAQGKALVAADVDLIAFTGSREAGKNILREASGSLKRVILELGGKDPMVVLEDADLEKAAQFAAMNSYRNAGQVCVSTERIFVHESVADAFEDLLARATAQMEVGPMVNARQRDHVLAQVREAVEKGARIRAGGTEARGNFIQPTLLSGVTDDMAIAREETFGPIACVSRVASDEEAVRRANDTRFGLGAVVFGRGDHAEAVARRLKAGMIGVNKSIGGTRGTPWVGARESGYGFHGSRDGHRQFTQTRVVSRPLAD